MASAIVRARVTSALQSLAVSPEEYVEIKAVRVDNEALPAKFLAVEFINPNERRISLGSPACWRETGTARVWVAGLSGGGEVPIVERADEVREFFRGWSVPADKISVESVSPPSQVLQQSAGRWFMLVVDVAFKRDSHQ